jgi:hypothetical protein
MINPILQFLETAAIQPPFDMLERYENGLASRQECILMAEYLKNQTSTDHNNFLIEKASDTVIQTSLEKLNQLLEKKTDNRKKIRLAYRHDIQPYQIWSTRTRQYSIFAESIHTFYPYMVMIKTAPQIYPDNHAIIRVQPVSFIMDFLSEGDVVIDDMELLGIPFIIETWNEQPMLESGLQEHIGKLNLPLPKPSGPNSQNETEREQTSRFRYLEIQNTAYLRRPVLALVEYYEKFDHERCMIHDGDRPDLIPLMKPETYVADSYMAMAAKSGSAGRQRQHLSWKGILTDISCELIIMPFDKQFDLVLSSDEGKLQLFDLELNPVPVVPIQQPDRRIYQRIDSGIYFIGTEHQVGMEHLILKLTSDTLTGE